MTVTHVSVLMTALPIFLDSTQQIATQIQPLVDDAITILQILFPLIAVFRIVYRFAEHREASMTVVVTEIVVIIFVALVFGEILKNILKALGL